MIFISQRKPMRSKIILLLLCLVVGILSCDPCYNDHLNNNCANDQEGKQSYTLHMSVHPHLDAFWIFNFQSYYDPKPDEGEVRGYFASNRFNSVKEIFTTATNVLWESKRVRQLQSNNTQQAHRTFMNSEMGFFKRWYLEQNDQEKSKVKEILKTKYWEILGGGFVEHDQGCAYYDDIIENFELGLHFLKEQFNYYPRVAISADSFGHSQSSLAILAHLGVQGYFVQRSDEHVLLQNKTEFVWLAKSANNKVYGALPTHIRWAIHGFQDQFAGGNVNQNFCQTKQGYMNNLRNQNKFLKRILKSTHIMRYFGHDFQRFDDYSYRVIENMMKKFSMQKCNKVVAVYGNPTEYFITLMGQVYGKKIKPLKTRSEDIFPIWDYDSGLYWTGYFTTDAYHKKSYRDMGRLLRGIRKFYLPLYLSDPNSDKNKLYYNKLQLLAQQVSYLQHHDGISGTSKYMVMDTLQKDNQQLYKFVTEHIFQDIFTDQFPLETNAPIFICSYGETCSIPADNLGDIYLKVLNSDGNPLRDPLVLNLPFNQFYQPDCEHQFNCFCRQQHCPCKLYIYKPLATYSAIRLTKLESSSNLKLNKLVQFVPNNKFYYNDTHFKINYDNKEYGIGYKRVGARGTNRQYDHLTRYGTQGARGFNIRPGKYALGNDPNDVTDISTIQSVSTLHSQSYTFFLIHWKRYSMKTLVSIPSSRPNQWKIETVSATESYHLQDFYFQVVTPINNDHKFVTDSNGWLTVNRQLFKHQDYQAFFQKNKLDDLNGNSYPATAFVYIKDGNDKVSVNLDRPQGVTAYRPGTIWINFDRLTEDDGKWVYESASRSQYQKYTHIITVKNVNYNQRIIQRKYDQPLFIQGNVLSPAARIQSAEVDFNKRNQWNKISNLDTLKFNLRPFNDSTTILRLQNMHDEDTINVGLFAGNHSPLLTTFYGRSISFDSLSERSLGGNMQYSQFINSKWNWRQVVDLTQENKIFNKIFRENITLAPLEIRTFLFKNLKFDTKCMETSQITYNNKQIIYEINSNKPAPTRDPLRMKIQSDIITYMKQADHCSDQSPVLKKINISIDQKNAETGHTQSEFVAIPIQKEIHIDLKTQPIKTETVALPRTQNTQIDNKPSQQILAPLIGNNDSVKILQEKIQLLRPLTSQQKQIYFSKKLQMIRSMKALNS